MTNVGSRDRTIRFIVGAILLVSPFLSPLAAFFAAWGAWKFAVVAVGVVESEIAQIVGMAKLALYDLDGLFVFGVVKVAVEEQVCPGIMLEDPFDVFADENGLVAAHGGLLALFYFAARF